MITGTQDVRWLSTSVLTRLFKAIRELQGTAGFLLSGLAISLPSGPRTLQADFKHPWTQAHCHTFMLAIQLTQLQVITPKSGRSHFLLKAHLAPFCWEDVMEEEDLWVRERILPKVNRKPTGPRTRRGPRSPRHRSIGNSHTTGHAQLPSR